VLGAVRVGVSVGGELFGVGAVVAIAGGFDGHGWRRRFRLRKEPQRTVGFERGDAKHEAGETGLGARIARISISCRMYRYL
jgi:hypothetical protein